MRWKQADLIAGMFVLCGAALIVTIFIIVRGQIGQQDRYHTFFSNVAGLRAGAVVVYEGYTIGSVDSIDPLAGDEGMKFRVNLDIQPDWQIPQDSLAEISATSLLSANAIQIKAGTGASLAVGSEIPSMNAVNVMAEISRTADKLTGIAQIHLAPLIDTVRDLLDKEGRTALAGISGLTNEISRQTPDIMANMNRASQNVADIASEANGKTISRTLDNLERTSQAGLDIVKRAEDVASDINVARINAVFAHFEQASTDLQATLQTAQNAAKNIEAMTDDQNAKRIEQVLVRVSNTVAAMNEVVSSSLKTTNVIQDMSIASSDRVEAFLLKMENVSLNLEDMTARLRDNPSLLILGSE